ncbi:MAG: hypothetical protein P8P88_04820 [Polaribacter sp.]|nr:hypothetical protein [Polaribacter sp.]
MKAFLYKFTFSILLVFCVQSINAQDPNWSLNTSDYQFSMTFTSFLNVNGATLTSPNDKVGAFVNGEIRGVANVIYQSNVNKYVAYLSVYANTNKEIINFKIYDSTSDSMLDVDKTETFIIDGNIGGISQSYSIASPELNNEAVFNSFNFLGITSISEDISSDKINIVVPKDTNISNLTAVFTTSTGAKVYVNTLLQQSGGSVQNFNNLVTYALFSENEAVIKEYEVSVSAASNDDPTSILITSTESLNTNLALIPLEIIFSNDITGFNISDFVLENAIISSFTKIGLKNYKVEIHPLSQGYISVLIPEGVVSGQDSNQNQQSNRIEFNYDIVKPIISDVSVDFTSDSWWFIITFNEEVLNVDATDFELKGEAAKNVNISEVTLISENQYIVKISSSNSEIGLVSLQLKEDSDIKDLSENVIVFSEFEAYFLNNISLLSNSFIAKMFIEGAYNVNSGMMNDDLRIKGFIPLNSPYSDALIVSQNVLNISGQNAIVDWVWIEIRSNSNESSNEFTTSALIQRDGDIVDIDGVSAIKIEIPVGSYYIVLNHRNHLGVRTNDYVLFSGADVNINLSNNSALVLGDLNAIKVMSDGKLALYSGDYNGDGQIQNTDKNAVEPLRGISGYRNADIDMNGEIQNSDLNNVLIPNIGKGEQYSGKKLNAKRRKIN